MSCSLRLLVARASHPDARLFIRACRTEQLKALASLQEQVALVIACGPTHSNAPQTRSNMALFRGMQQVSETVRSSASLCEYVQQSLCCCSSLPRLLTCRSCMQFALRWTPRAYRCTFAPCWRCASDPDLSAGGVHEKARAGAQIR